MVHYSTDPGIAVPEVPEARSSRSDHSPISGNIGPKSCFLDLSFSHISVILLGRAQPEASFPKEIDHGKAPPNASFVSLYCEIDLDPAGPQLSDYASALSCGSTFVKG